MAVIDTAPERSAIYQAGLSVPVAIVGLALLAAALHVVTPFNHDEAYFLEAARRLLDGGRFGKDIVDLNPPHVHWISAMPVWLAREIGVRSDIVATFFTAAMAAASLIASDRLIASGWSAVSVPRVWLPIAAIVVLFAPAYDFGQREHWMVLLTLPYIIARSRRADGIAPSRAAAALIGVVACFGFCIKPYYLLVPIAIELWLLARTRRLAVWISPETMAMAITGLVYLLAVIVYMPTYFERQLPDAVLGYWAFESPLPAVLWDAVLLVAPAAALGLLGYATLRRGERVPTLAQAFAVAGVAFLIGALLQMKAWSYHFLPSVIFLELAAAVLLIGGAARADARTLRLAGLLVLSLVACSFSAVLAVRSFENVGTTARVGQLAAVFRSHPGPNGTMAGFITSPRDVYPAVVAARMKWAVTTCCDYLIAASVRADEAPAARRPAIKAAGLKQAERIVAEIRASEPGVIVIDAGYPKLGFGSRQFDYLPWLKAHTDLAGILRHYREINPVGRFRLFVRK